MITYTRQEKDIMCRVQAAISESGKMCESLLRAILYQLVPEDINPKDSGISRRKLERRVLDWWMYVGQWEWPQWSCGKKTSDEIASEILKDDIKTLVYPDDEYEFGINKDEFPLSALSVEIRPMTGKFSLWPEIHDLAGYSSWEDFLQQNGYDKETSLKCAFCKQIDTLEEEEVNLEEDKEEIVEEEINEVEEDQ